MQYHVFLFPRNRSLWTVILVVALAAAFFVAGGVPSALAQSRVDRPDLRITKASFNGRDLHVEYVNATGVYDRRRYEVGFQWHDVGGRPVGERHWLPQPEVERGGVAILDTKYRIDLTYRRSGSNYNRRLLDFILQRPNMAEELRVTVDDGDRIPEMDETNNVASLKIPLPDLQITSAKFLTPNRLEISYRNANPSPIPLPFRIGFTWAEEGGAYANATRWINVLEPAAGATETVVLSRTDASYITASGRQAGDRLDWYFERRPGNATRLKVTIDDAGEVREVNEHDNVVTARPFLPDLVVRDAKLEGGRLTFTYGNAGEGGMRDSASRVLFQWRNAAGQPVGTPRWYRFAQMNPKQLFPVKAERFDVEYAVTGTNRTATQRIDAYLREQPPDAVRLTITVDDEQRISEADETNNTETVTPAPPPKPDLTIEAITIDADGQPHATVWNRGEGRADSVVVSHEYRDRAGTPLGGGSRETAPLGLGAGQKITDAILGTIPDAAVTVAVTVDPKNAVAETDEQNNAKEAPAPMADLVVVEAQPTPNGTLALTYRNAGNRKADPLSIWLHFADAQGAQIGPLYWMNVSPIRAGGTQVLANETEHAFSSAGAVELQELFASPPAGATHIKTILDGPDRVVESNEGNNVVLLAKPVGPLPDLAIADLALTADQATWKLRNVGDPLPPTQALTFVVEFQWFDQSGAPVGPSAGINSDIFFPTPTYVHNRSTGYSGSASSDYILRRPAGAAKLRVTEDSANVIREKDETNNVAEVALPPPPQPDLTFARTALIPDAPDPRIDYVLKNAGTADTTGGVLELQWLIADGKPTGPAHAFVTYGLLKPGDRATRGLLMQDSGPKPGQTGRYLLLPPEDATQIRLMLDPMNVIAESDEANNVAVLARPAAVPLSDLAVTEARITLDAFALTYQNAGSVRAGLGAPLSTWFEWVDASGGRVGELAWHDGETLPPKYRTQIEVETKVSSASRSNFPLREFLNAPPDGATHLKVLLDGPNTLLEANETNNTALLLRPNVPLPDLAFTSVFLVPPSRERLVIGFRNNGKATAPEFSWAMAWIDATGARSGTTYEGTVPTLRPNWQFGASSDMSDSKGMPMPIGQWLAQPKPDGAVQLEIVIDPNQKIAESDEQNNRATFSEWSPLEPENKPPVADAGEDATARDDDGDGVEVVRFYSRNSKDPDGKVVSWVWTFGGKEIATGQYPYWRSAPVGTHVVTLTVTDDKGATATDTVTITVESKPTTPPDLVVAELTWEPRLPQVGDVVAFTVRVENRGGSRVGQVSVTSLDVDEGNNGTRDVPLAQFTTKDLDRGASETLHWKREYGRGYTWDAVAGTHAFLACADAKGVVRESDDTNNCARRVVTVGAAEEDTSRAPDLTWRAFLRDKTSYTYGIQMDNIGDADAPPHAWEIQWVDADRKPVGPPARYTFNSTLNAGKSVGNTVQYRKGVSTTSYDKYTLAPPSGAVMLRLTVDPDNAIPERNEANNSITLDPPPKPKEIPKPDLIVERILLSPSKPTLGDRVEFAAVIRNVGTAPIEESVAYYVLDLGNDGDPERAPEPAEIPALAAGAAHTVRWPDAEALPEGTHAVEVCADVAEEVAEANEENNCRELTFTVRVPERTSWLLLPLRFAFDVFSTPIRAGSFE